jgi:peptide/nickel transport system substrate-binding protein
MLLLVVLCALSGCTKVAGNTGGRHPWTQAGNLRIGITEEPKNLNPLLFGTTTEDFVDRLLFEPLLSADDRGNPVPMLATVVPSMANGGISRDGLNITYHLAANARWSDGVPVTSADVAWSWAAIENSANDVVSRHGYDDVRSITTPDAHSVVVHLKQRFSPFVNTFFAESDQPYEIVPKHVLAQYPDINHVPFDAAPTVSDGPFKFVEWRRGDRILLAANSLFFRDAPKLQRITLDFVPNEDTEVNLLRRTPSTTFFSLPFKRIRR